MRSLLRPAAGAEAAGRGAPRGVHNTGRHCSTAGGDEAHRGGKQSPIVAAAVMWAGGHSVLPRRRCDVKSNFDVLI